jgi:hypothetical protein
MIAGWASACWTRAARGKRYSQAREGPAGGFAMRYLQAFGAAVRARAAARPWVSAAMAFVGLGMGLLIVTNSGHRVLPAWLVPIIIAGGTLLSWVTGTIVAGSSIPVKNTQFWETGALGWFATTAAFGACAALAWGMLLSVAFGTIVR